MTANTDKSSFTRSLNPTGVIFLTFSALSPVVSVYVFGSGVIHIAGTGAIMALGVGGLAMAIVGLLYGELGAAFPDAGGLYPAFARILGTATAFAYVAMMVFVAPALMAFGLLGIADNIVAVVPGLSQIPVAICCVLAATAVAILNIRTGAIITGLFLLIELFALATITTIAALHPVHALVPTIVHPVVATSGGLAPLRLPLLGVAIVAGAYTCSGTTFALYYAQELHDPRRGIGTAVNWISPLASLSIACPLILALLAAPDLQAMIASDAPVATFLKQTTSPAVAAFIEYGVMIAMFNAAIAMLMGLGRFLYATARDQLWPVPIGRMIGRLHPTLHSPVNATLALAAVSIAMLALGERILLVLISNQLMLEFLLMGAAVLLGRRRGLTGIYHKAPLDVLPRNPAIGKLARQMETSDAAKPIYRRSDHRRAA